MTTSPRPIRPRRDGIGATPTGLELRIEAATRLYRAAPTLAAWHALSGAIATALAHYGRLPLDSRQQQDRAVLADLEWRGIAVHPDHAAIERGGSMNPNPVKARQEQQKKSRTRRSKGSLSAVQGLLWAALERAGDLLDDPDPVRVLKAVHAISTGAGAYARVCDAAELAGRLDALESRLAAQGAG